MFQSSWGNPQNQPPQSQTSNAFGQPSAFGTSGFGSTGAFGQPQQQQQPAANPMFGNLGTTSTTPASTGFGAFGGTGTTQNTTNTMFGSKPATGFGAFGGGGGGGGTTPAFGSTTSGTNPFGQTPSGTTAFGQPSTSATNAFGGGSIFNTKPAFGSTETTQQPATVPTAGTSNPPYAVTTERDGSITLQYQAITCMPAYINASFEELRYQDYQQGRKTAGQFGQSAAFGGATANPQQPATTNFFNPQPATNTTNPFGSTTGTSNFGAFGQPNQTPASTGTGAFGSGGNAFGNTQQPQQTTNAFGSFGATQNQGQQGGSFGGFGNPTAPKTGFGSFGGTGFGSTPSAFSGSQQPQQPQQPQTTFGSTPAAPATNAFSSFGATNTNQPKSIFNTPLNTTPASGGGFGSFGQSSQQQPQQSSPFGSTPFGAPASQQQPGQTNHATTPAFGAPAGASGTTTTSFGSTFPSLGGQQNQPQQPQQPAATAFPAFGGFGATKPATSTIFNQGQPAGGAAPLAGFGSTPTQGATATNSFGSSWLKPAQPSTTPSMFGSFGAPAASTTAPPPLTASIAQPLGENLTIQNLLNGPRITDLDQSQTKKKPGFFVDVPTRSPVPRIQLGYSPAASKPRGFATSTLGGLNGSINAQASVSFINGKPGALSLSKLAEPGKAGGLGDSLLGRSSSPSLGSGGRQSVKKLILPSKVDPADIFVKTGGSSGSLRSNGKIVFSPVLSVASREKDSEAPISLTSTPPTRPAGEASKSAGAIESARQPLQQQRSNRFTAHGSSQSIGGDEVVDVDALEEGDYWVKPDLSVLKNAGYDELSSFNNLVVGRVGYGEIHFLEPVDLTGLSRLGALLGEVVRFDDKECSVYPDNDEVDKPPPGSGLNVRARIILTRCWAVDKATREPIKDATNPMAVKHLKRLKNMKDTHFESFDIQDGKWTFTVDNF
ncbi:hypothetical protein AX16_007254 [Volvariella volvacea WC 439]|nr:hypothetical protein AX16_007254 [Volvariella volvacea WC 439]